MSAPTQLAFEKLNVALKAAGEATRLRILALLGEAELTVSDLTAILRQSQPRTSRHLRLMAQAGLVDRFREGAWAFFRLGERGGGAALARELIARLDPADLTLARDRERLAAVRAQRAAAQAPRPRPVRGKRSGGMRAEPRPSRFAHASDARPIRVSFEFFPPKTEEMERTLWESITRLAPLRPNFVSVTYGAGGSTRERTHSTVRRILAETALEPAAHLTCVAAAREEVDAVIRDYCTAGVRHIVALRGDPIGGLGERYAPHPGGYRNAADLVAGIKRLADIEVSVSAYPEKHPDSPTVEADLDMLAAKVDAGATRAITQFFFENDRYFDYLDRVRASGIEVPIVPGILPVQNFKQMRAFAERCGTSVPGWLADRFAGLDADAATRKLIAAAVAAEQVLDLVDRGVTDFHFYTMNRADLVYAVCHLLGLRPRQGQDELSHPLGENNSLRDERVGARHASPLQG